MIEEELDKAAESKLAKFEPYDEKANGFPRPPLYFEHHMTMMFEAGARWMEERGKPLIDWVEKVREILIQIEAKELLAELEEIVGVE